MGVPGQAEVEGRHGRAEVEGRAGVPTEGGLRRRGAEGVLRRRGHAERKPEAGGRGRWGPGEVVLLRPAVKKQTRRGAAASGRGPFARQSAVEGV